MEEAARMMSGVHLATNMGEVMVLLEDFAYSILPVEKVQKMLLIWRNTMMQQMKWETKLSQGHICPDAYNTPWNACRHCLERMIEDEDYPTLYSLVEDLMQAEEVQKGLGFK
jgi:hypothetical protein